MTFLVGRCELGTVPSQLDHDGDTLQAAGWFHSASLPAAKVLRQQLLGLVEEGVVPVVATFDSDFDGFYVVRSSNVTPVLGVSYEGFSFQYSLDLARIGTYSAPVVELTVSALERDPDPSASSYALVGFPAAATWWTNLSSSVVPSSRASETGAVSLQSTDVSAGTAFDLTLQYKVPPADFYDGSALIEQSVSGTWYPVVGRQLPQITAAQIRVGNSMVRCTISTGAAISLAVWNGSAWESLAQTFSVGAGIIASASAFAVSATYNVASAPSILVNSPDLVVVRVPCTNVSEGIAFHLDISVRRGDRLVEFQGSGLPLVPASAGTANDWTICASAGAVTHHTSATNSEAIYLTANDASGNRWVLASNEATSYDTADFGLAGEGDDPVWMIGIELDGTGATGINELEALLGQWWASTSVSAQVVVA
jgi:hypothetical protein